MSVTNMVQMVRSRKPPTTGDVFTVQFLPAQYLFGRVVIADAPEGPMPHSNLLYLYDVVREVPGVPLDMLTPDRLLIYPFFTNALAWSHGLFQTLDNVPLRDKDVLSRHVFDMTDGKCVDESYRRVKCGNGPVGLWALVSYRWVDDRIAEPPSSGDLDT